MNPKKLSEISLAGIKISFVLLLSITPFLFTAVNSELFEFNKMIFTYILTIIILFFWISRMILEQKIIFKKSFLNLPLIIFYLSQAISTLFSHDIYMSLFGYYSRFNQGLLSLTAYLVLYFAFTSNIQILVHPSEIRVNQKSYINKLIIIMILGSLIIAMYGILQHFGIDYFHWVQDVKTRVFSTLGQPNWLGAYLCITIIISFGLWLDLLKHKKTALSQNSKSEIPNFKINLNSKFKNLNSENLNNGTIEQSNNNHLNHLLKTYILPLTVITVLYTSLLFTRSRSSFTAFHFCLLILTIYIFVNKNLSNLKKPIIITYLLFFTLINIFNILPTPIEKLNNLTLPNLINKFLIVGTSRDLSLPKNTSVKPTPPETPQGEGGTESFAIRKIVWQGAWNTFIANPLVGYGTETFALAYYKYKPLDQNMVSEWDFLYNKAHNEYLNYLATTGILGFGAYLLFIISFCWYFWKNIFLNCHCKQSAAIFPYNNKNTSSVPSTPSRNDNESNYFLKISLFLAWISILITNFVGFSVVVISLYFYLIPTIIIILNQPSESKAESKKEYTKTDQQPTRIATQSVAGGFDNITIKQYIFLSILLLTTYYILHASISWWFADLRYKTALDASNSEEYQTAFQNYQEAIDLSPFHPSYHNEYAMLLSEMPSYLPEKTDDTIISKIAARAIEESDIAISISPENPLFWNYRALIFHNLASLNKSYNQEAVSSILKAENLAPNDPKIAYFTGIYYLSNSQNDKTLKYFEKTVKLKPNYIEPTVNLAKIYHDQGRKKESVQLLQNLLKYYPANTNIFKLIKSYSN
jgi:putative inorganic carbon (hco3(-)) transporter